jgi:hypothetical protein
MRGPEAADFEISSGTTFANPDAKSLTSPIAQDDMPTSCAISNWGRSVPVCDSLHVGRGDEECLKFGFGFRSYGYKPGRICGFDELRADVPIHRAPHSAHVGIQIRDYQSCGENYDQRRVAGVPQHTRISTTI